MKSIGLWDSNHPEDVTDIALIYPDQVADFAELLSEGLIRKPLQAFKLAENSRGKEIAIAFYLACKNHPEGLSFHRSVSTCSAVYLAWNEIVRSLASWDAKSYRVAKHMLANTEAFRQISGATVVLESLDYFVEHLIQVMTEHTPFHKSPEIYYADWWAHRNGLRERMETDSAQIRTKIQPDQLKTWAQQISEHTSRKLSKLESLPPEKSFYELSLYYMALALKLYEQSRYTTSLLLTHRALDCFVQSYAINHNLVTLTASGLRYKSTDDSHLPVSLNNTYKFLVRENQFTSNKDRVDFLKWLNNARNQSLFTHGVYGFTEGKAKKSLDGAIKLACDIEGNNRWRELIRQYLAELHIPIDCLFYLDGGIDTNLEMIELS